MCVCHSASMCGPLFMREINGSLARETNTEKSAVCVGAIPMAFTTAQCYFCSFISSLSTVSQNNQQLFSCLFSNFLLLKNLIAVRRVSDSDLELPLNQPHCSFAELVFHLVSLDPFVVV